jgi:hypothetical protein
MAPSSGPRSQHDEPLYTDGEQRVHDVRPQQRHQQAPRRAGGDKRRELLEASEMLPHLLSMHSSAEFAQAATLDGRQLHTINVTDLLASVPANELPQGSLVSGKLILVLMLWGPALACVVFAIGWAVDQFTQLGSGHHQSFVDTLAVLVNAIDRHYYANVMAFVNTLMSLLAVLFIATCVILQLASTRYSVAVFKMFMRQRFAGLTLVFVVVSGIAAVLPAALVHHGYVPNAAGFAALVLCSMSTQLLYPYFLFLFRFLRPTSIIVATLCRALAVLQELHRNARSVALITPDDPQHDARTQQLRKDAITGQRHVFAMLAEHAEHARRAAQAPRRRRVRSRMLDALQAFAVVLGREKGALPAAWFRVPGWMRAHPTLAGLTAHAIERVEARRTLYEMTAMSSMLSLFKIARQRGDMVRGGARRAWRGGAGVCVLVRVVCVGAGRDGPGRAGEWCGWARDVTVWQVANRPRGCCM